MLSDGGKVNDKELIGWARFVSTKFSKNVEGWTYSRNTDGLKHIRYESDYTGYNHWTKRLTGGLAFAWSHTIHSQKGSLAAQLGGVEKGLSPWRRMQQFYAYFMVRMRKDKNLPDGQINGIITHWEEDGEYIALFQPRVGVKVLEFIEDNPDNEYAKAILAVMHDCAELSWPSKEDEE